MAGEDHLTLLVQAAVDGVVDFSQARLRDPAWWTRLRFLLNGLDQKNQRDRLQLHLANVRCLVSTERVASDDWRRQLQHMQELTDKYKATYFPDLKPVTKEAEAVELRDSWQEHFGNLNDPKVQSAIDKLLAEWAAEDMKPELPKPKVRRPPSGIRRRGL